LLQNPTALAYAVEQIACRWRGKVDSVAALDARGFLFGTPVALALGAPFIPIRKKGKLPGETESLTYKLEYGEDTLEIKKGALHHGARVLVVDDLLATGGTVSAACALVQKIGATVVGCAFVVEVRELGGRACLPCVNVLSLVTY
jgi:adenine phosphoribosyltransferase